MTSRTTRAARGLAAAAIALFLAALSHVAAGGGAPGQAGAALAAAFAALVCVGLAGRRLSVPRLAIAVLISQFAFHLLFGVGSGTGSGLAVATAHHHGRAVSTLVPDALQSSLAATPAHAHDSGWMWVSHAVAAVLTVLVLARGELAARRLLALARHRIWQPVRVLAGRVATATLARLAVVLHAAVTENSPPVHRLRQFSVAVGPALTEWMLALGSLGHRGPPKGFAAHPSF
ncbi:hypothetical protein [Herbiconiux sp. VKM Ac-2851]|uniref:hypothetical protein n=1 Tax=Herbiconiux sp. VKM Ac-2851 TaxID=2739025 RepID=UPI0015673FEC|nr:hypothetical protein [Herbiconiux sp. VKM Ac-2851]NQX34896.1 hypothetical protein [Herbiconiux sp. VKM Ac-2851]